MMAAGMRARTRGAAALRRAVVAPAFAAVFAAASAVTFTACTQGEVRAVAVGAPAPSYAAERLDGTPVSLAELRGQVVLLNIWATWCKPCREEIPALEVLHQRHASQGLLVAGVSIDLPGEKPRVESFARALGATYPLWLDPDDRVSNTFLAIGVPATYLIGRDGTLRWKHMGPVTADDPALTAALTAALSEPAPAAAP